MIRGHATTQLKNRAIIYWSIDDWHERNDEDEDDEDYKDCDDDDENCSGIKGVIDEQKTDGKMITVLAYIGV